MGSLPQILEFLEQPHWNRPKRQLNSSKKAQLSRLNYSSNERRQLHRELHALLQRVWEEEDVLRDFWDASVIPKHKKKQ